MLWRISLRMLKCKVRIFFFNRNGKIKNHEVCKNVKKGKGISVTQKKKKKGNNIMVWYSLRETLNFP